MVMMVGLVMALRMGLFDGDNEGVRIVMGKVMAVIIVLTRAVITIRPFFYCG